MALVVKNLPANAGDIRNVVLILGWEDPLEKGMATHPRILAWRFPWTEEPGGLQSMRLKRVRPAEVTEHVSSSSQDAGYFLSSQPALAENQRACWPQISSHQDPLIFMSRAAHSQVPIIPL